jgi:putative transposase
MKFRFIREHSTQYPIFSICETLNVSRAGYYAWLQRPQSRRSQANQALVNKIRVLHAESRKTYGAPRIHRALRNDGQLVSYNRVERLMRANGILGKQKKRFKVTGYSKHSFPIAANLLDRSFNVKIPDRFWVSDITCIWTREGWLYLAVTLDLFSRKVIGWAMDSRVQSDLVGGAFNMALNNRKPRPGLVHHSDRGCQYACDDYQALLTKNRAVCSMSRKGNCWDNAAQESFFGKLKSEHVRDRVYTTKEEAKLDLFWYIEVFYNRIRRHAALGYVAPAEFEARGIKGAAA